MAYIYRHIRLDKNEPFYIGVGLTDDKYSRSRKKSGRNNLWKKIVKKTDYRIEIMLESESNDFILEKEVELIKLYGRIDLGTGTLANLTDGGEGVLNRIVSDEEKEIHRLHAINYFSDIKNREFIGNLHRGKVHTKEHREKIEKTKGKRTLSNAQREHLRNVNLGLKKSDETKEKLRQKALIQFSNSENLEKHKLLNCKYIYRILNIKTNDLYEDVINLRQFCRDFQLSHSNLINTLKGKTKKGVTCTQCKNFKILSKTLINKQNV